MTMNRLASRVALLGLALLLPACGSSGMTDKQALAAYDEVDSAMSYAYGIATDMVRSRTPGVTATGQLPGLYSLRGTLINDGANTGQVTVTTDETDTDYRYAFDFDGWQTATGLRITGALKRQGHMDGTPTGLDEKVSGTVTLANTVHAVGDIAVTYKAAAGCINLVGEVAGVAIKRSGCAKEPAAQP